MKQYQSLLAEPQLSRVEQLVCQIICNLDAAQTSHRYSDPNAPSPPRRIELEDLYWDGFVISQRFRDSKHGYIVAAPISSEPFRCVVLESSGRFFCSSLVRANCGPPAADDFAWVLMRTNTRDLDIRRARASERRKSAVYLPSCYASWKAMN